MPTVISKDGTRIAYDKAGSGPAVIVVSGALAQRGLYDDGSLAGALSPHFTVYTYDRRGRGESGDGSSYAVAREIEDIAALIDAAGGRVFLFGASSGAALSLQAAAQLGADKVAKLALYEPPYGQPREDFEAQKNGVNTRIESGAPGDAAAFFMAAIGTPPEVQEEMQTAPEWAVISRIDFTLAYDYAVLGNGEVPWGILAGIRVPTLVMDGEKGVPFMKQAVEDIARGIAGAERRTLAGQGHQADGEVLGAALRGFFGEG
jgi:pimeloyl-ACP methyl ester carboxylesterase